MSVCAGIGKALFSLLPITLPQKLSGSTNGTSNTCVEQVPQDMTLISDAIS